MKRIFTSLMNHSYLPSWMVLFCDLAIFSISFIFSYLLSQNISGHFLDMNLIFLQMLTGVPFFYLAYYMLQPHRGIIRHSTTQDAAIIILAHLIITMGLMTVSLLGHVFANKFAIPYSIVLIHYFISVLIMISFRFSIKFIFYYLSVLPGEVHKVLIFGAGNKGQITREVIEKDRSLGIKLIGFIDDNWQLQNKILGGLPVYSEEKAFEMIIGSEKVKEIIIAINHDKISNDRRRQIINLCLEKHIKVSDVPDTSLWIDGSLSVKQIKEIQIEDLLGRDPIVLNKDRIAQGLYRQTILVTGAAGSIGSELIRQILNFHPGQIILVDQAESALFDLQTEIKDKLNGLNTIFVIGSVTDKFRMRKIFQKYRPEVVFHAAAYKHVPLMEIQPYEAIKCNIGGIKVMADLSVEFGVDKFVMVSTDKAVNPTNVMGATKRICEIYVQSLSQIPDMKTHFITTRFGNVLGSNGSVIPLFKKQISKGGPITVTHRNITRYFMTIPEACQLVLEAGFMGKGGEIFLFDMGQPVQIYDLAEKMILLSGLTPHKDIKIEISGLRPGEKLYEELLASAEDTLPSFHNKILIGKIRHYNYNDQNLKVTELLNSITRENDESLVARMKDLVPEFISNNSVFESLDKQDKDASSNGPHRKIKLPSGIIASKSDFFA
ncbi:MAG: polysaccharide biosynthesis protein [Prolixibacteraceae bacterium]|nr:polysaccharide biosynthesis protein [Prolixibacteraceae bacterium]